jgi:hypothetical protein
MKKMFFDVIRGTESPASAPLEALATVGFDDFSNV